MNEMMMMNEYFQHLFVVAVQVLNIEYFSRKKNICTCIVSFEWYLPTVVDCNNWLKLIVSEEETGVWITALLSDDIVELLLLFVVCVRSKSDVDDVLKRKFSKPGGGGPIDCCLQTKSLTWFKKTSSNVLFDVSLLLSIELFDVVVCVNDDDDDDGVVVTRDETNKAAKSASVKL